MHSLMANYRIGVLTMKAIEFEIKRTEIREQERLERENEYNTELSKAKENLLEYPKILEKIKKNRDKEQTKQKIFLRKQDKLLFISFYILLNLAEDISVERKMIKKDLIQYIVTILSTHHFEDLLILLMTFAKKLVVFEENKNAFKDNAIIEVLGRFIPCSSQPLVLITLRLLFNLSFDKVHHIFCYSMVSWHLIFLYLVLLYME
jgi:hypothetical protein